MSNKLADYIFFRLHQLDIFGVPGDYNLRLLDWVLQEALIRSRPVFLQVPDDMINNDIYHDILSSNFLPPLLQTLDPNHIPKATGPSKPTIKAIHHNTYGSITQSYFYHTVNPLFRSGELILTETGTAAPRRPQLYLTSKHPSIRPRHLAINWIHALRDTRPDISLTLADQWPQYSRDSLHRRWESRDVRAGNKH
ncbi:hypothetical protein BDV23DRAFT_183568 [Aspergillus alliaceus]|uniref:Uncharacterized protein n=1 Tax=Petromyces alliaceus TaxID=209559 RepID=A0A5N7C7Z9_PETAA|nr:hypothetical protein BDV23DRAFT_183568 [Aspergillus alliaceus]